MNAKEFLTFEVRSKAVCL